MTVTGYIGASGASKTMVWRAWGAAGGAVSTDTTSTAVTVSHNPWGYWVHQSNAGTSATSTTWETWTTASGVATTGTYIISDPYQAWAEQVEVKKLTKAEIKAERKRKADAELAARERQKEAARVMAEAEAKRKLASQRAEELLLSHLSDEQEKAWREERAIFVTSQSGKRFKIKEGRAHNIFELGPDNIPIREYCVHVAEDVPNADNVLAQKLALEHGEAALLRIANSWPMVNGRR